MHVRVYRGGLFRLPSHYLEGLKTLRPPNKVRRQQSKDIDRLTALQRAIFFCYRAHSVTGHIQDIDVEPADGGLQMGLRPPWISTLFQSKSCRCHADRRSDGAALRSRAAANSNAAAQSISFYQTVWSGVVRCCCCLFKWPNKMRVCSGCCCFGAGRRLQSWINSAAADLIVYSTWWLCECECVCQILRSHSVKSGCCSASLWLMGRNEVLWCTKTAFISIRKSFSWREKYVYKGWRDSKRLKVGLKGT